MLKLGKFGPVDSVYFGYSSDPEIRFSASSGGFVTSFVVHLIDSGAVDAAIVTRTGGHDEPLISETIITSSKNDILSPRTNSIYAPVNPLRVLADTSPNKRYVFVGLPCHISEIRKLQQAGLYRNIWPLISLFCGYTPKTDFTHRVLAKIGVHAEQVLQIDYRGNGWPGNFSAFLKDGSVKRILLSECWENDVQTGLPMCRTCARLGSEADITAGDPWNLELEKQDSNGKTLVVFRSAKMRHMALQAVAVGRVKLERCSIQKFWQSQGYHIAMKLARCGLPIPRLPIKTRLLYCLRHPLYSCRIAAQLIGISRFLLHLRYFLGKYRNIARSIGIGRLLNYIRHPLYSFRNAVRSIKVGQLRDIADIIATRSFVYLLCYVPFLKPLLRPFFLNRVLAWHWMEERRIVNFGELITEKLISKFGYRTTPFCVARTFGIIDHFPFCMVIIGSGIRETAHFEAPVFGQKQSVSMEPIKLLYIWGQGNGCGERVDIDQRRITVFAVRGPETARLSNLSDVALGDPGFLLPLFFKIELPKTPQGVLFVPHNANRWDAALKCRKLGADTYLDIFCSRSQFMHWLHRLVSSEFVLTSSLHTVIVCQAYGVPWALCLAEGDVLNMPQKWRDLFMLLNIDLTPESHIVYNLTQGREWWKKVGSNIKIPNLLPLLESFPLEIKNPDVQRVIYEMRQRNRRDGSFA